MEMRRKNANKKYKARSKARKNKLYRLRTKIEWKSLEEYVLQIKKVERYGRERHIA